MRNDLQIPLWASMAGSSVIAILLLSGCAQKVSTTAQVAPFYRPVPDVKNSTSTSPLHSARINYGPIGGISTLSTKELGELPIYVRVHFPTNSSYLSPGNREIVKENAKFIEKFPKLWVLIEGNCDQRGTQEYNLALGWRRAKAVKDLMEKDGVPADQIKTTSFGKDNLLCYANTPSCWKKNRRADFVYKQRLKEH